MSLGQEALNDPVTRHMRQEFAAIRAEQTVAEALQSLRSQRLAEKIIYFYVVDAGEKLVGVVPTRRLLINSPQTKIADIMVSSVISIPSTMSVLDACEFFVLYRLLAFPVVDEGNKLVGVVDVGLFAEGVFNVSERETQQDIFQMIGVRLAEGKRSSWQAFKSRFPWLMCNITGGIICAFIAGAYEHLLDVVIVLALFIPVVLTLAEGVSMQSMTITLQGIRAGRIDWKRIFRSLRTELLTAAMLGVASGALVGLVAWGWKGHAEAAEAIGASICLAIITACLLGVILPTAVYALRGDPKIASGPIVLATADIATLLFYFSMAGWLLG